ncbi:FAD-binding and (Fe-S)-binding domain-containing protein [Aliiglaciecola sp. CAU 1673]|uniref:FAD-binding and (Fe-S)-binding domain-containing protein n=1 Tax=Aliiglaciecola sp. CAU 1673 TaxID=3032595 RepID=UPI0023DA2FBB|nr:FAD-binding and (Fe-S)-binding domain-containing protein [Aliiglaciecola sp. CAU 1673]MDF2176678.1 FAD-binding and (Fe-S)-binding domain-containing protein [Aliiglaciecola sp. CAU 1673]
MDFDGFCRALRQFLPEKAIIDDLSLRLAHAGDASFYHLVPKLLVRIDDIEQMQRLLSCSGEFRVPVTFRAAGTSLSGQAVTDSVLVLLTSNWRQAEVLEKGAKIRLQPGVIGARANEMLKPFGYKLGPDPASIDSCKIGGIAANNASGMCCGVKHNSYHTVEQMRLLLADGTLVDTASPDCLEVLTRRHPKLLAGLSRLSRVLQATPSLADKVRHKYRLKNTTGYGINALLDFDCPIEQIKHLMIGSEGTLGFIADITYQSVPLAPYQTSGLFVFDHIEHCCELVSALRQLDVQAVELMDASALAAVAQKQGMPKWQGELPEEAAALLIQLGASDNETLARQQVEVQALLENSRQRLICAAPFCQGEQEQLLWAIRKGLFPAVGANREPGTTVIIEDVAVPIEYLAKAVERLHGLFAQYDYHRAIIFGHALEGNLHFVFTQAFDNDEQVGRYDAMMQAVAEEILAFGGALKAEHGTGRNMAPFVRQEWGDELYGIMRELKRLFDPRGTLNPGVIINDDPKAHLKHLKAIPAVDAQIDECIECGFCEPVCPSKELTLTPRQRIALWRQLSQKNGLDPKSRQQVGEDYQYLGIDSCAATGLCASRCPVGIDTGAFIKSLRGRRQASPLSRFSATHWKMTGQLARFALKSAAISRDLLGEAVTEKISNGLYDISVKGVPKWNPALPGPAENVVELAGRGQPVIYFPSCANRWFGVQPGAQDERPVFQVIASVLKKAGYHMLLVDDADVLCCGQPWESQGQTTLANSKLEEARDKLIAMADDKSVPVLIDAASCALQLRRASTGLEIHDPASFIRDKVLPKLHIRPLSEPVMLHISCSAKRQGSEQALLEVAKACSTKVIVPKDIHCCGFAGNKGLTLPELNQSALTGLKAQVPGDCHQGISDNRTCEIGLSQHSGVPYQSVFYLLDKVSHSLGYTGDKAQEK